MWQAAKTLPKEGFLLLHKLPGSPCRASSSHIPQAASLQLQLQGPPGCHLTRSEVSWLPLTAPQEQSMCSKLHWAKIKQDNSTKQGSLLVPTCPGSCGGRKQLCCVNSSGHRWWWAAATCKAWSSNGVAAYAQFSLASWLALLCKHLPCLQLRAGGLWTTLCLFRRKYSGSNHGFMFLKSQQHHICRFIDATTSPVCHASSHSPVPT